MIPKEHNTTQFTQTKNNLNIKNAEVAVGPQHMLALSKNLYTRPMEAVLRELIANIKDEHVKCGYPDKPGLVILPNEFNNHILTIRDFECGIPEEDFEIHIIGFGFSDKRNSNSQIGMWGYGTKSPYVLTDAFTIINCFKNNDKIHEHTYNVFLHNNNPSFTKVSEKTYNLNDNIETGITYKIPYKMDYHDKDQIKNAIRFIDPIPDGLTREDEFLLKGKHYSFRKDNSYNGKMVMGGIGYDSSHFFKIDLYFDIGELELTPSRESVKHNNYMDEIIKAKYKLAKQEMADEIKKLNKEPINIVEKLKKLTIYNKITFHSCLENFFKLYPEYIFHNCSNIYVKKLKLAINVDSEYENIIIIEDDKKLTYRKERLRQNNFDKDYVKNFPNQKAFDDLVKEIGKFPHIMLKDAPFNKPVRNRTKTIKVAESSSNNTIVFQNQKIPKYYQIQSVNNIVNKKDEILKNLIIDYTSWHDKDYKNIPVFEIVPKSYKCDFPMISEWLTYIKNNNITFYYSTIYSKYYTEMFGNILQKPHDYPISHSSSHNAEYLIQMGLNMKNVDDLLTRMNNEIKKKHPIFDIVPMSPKNIEELRKYGYLNVKLKPQGNQKCM